MCKQIPWGHDENLLAAWEAGSLSLRGNTSAGFQEKWIPQAVYPKQFRVEVLGFKIVCWGCVGAPLFAAATI